MSTTNPRTVNGNFRRKMRRKFQTEGAPCGICRGALGPIRYDQPSDSAHPLSFVIDERLPVSRWREFGFASARAAAESVENLQAAHYVCNAKKGSKIQTQAGRGPGAKMQRESLSLSDGDW